MRLRVGFAILILLLAGCGGQTATPTGTAETTQTSAATPTTTPTPTASQTPTETATPRPTATATPRPPDNPWQTTPVTVAIADGTLDDSLRPQLAQALSFWEANVDETDYSELTFRIVEGTDDADIVVQTTDELTMCGNRLEPENVGCAPYPGTNGFTGQATIHIETGYTAESQVAILKHEFGHTLGLTHDTPMEIMKPEIALTNLPQTDAVDKANPWEQETVRIYVDDSEVSHEIRDDHNNHVDHAITYYQNGAEGFFPENVTLERTESAEDADITVTFTEQSEIGDAEAYSEAVVNGSDPDGDGALEVFEESEIRLAYDVRGDFHITSYNLGYMIAYNFGAQSGDYPPPWEQDTIRYDDHWWQRA